MPNRRKSARAGVYRVVAACALAALPLCAFGASPDAAPQASVTSSADVDLGALRALAEQGDKRAAFVLATYYIAGRGVPRDDSEAVRWFTSAADAGLAEAQYNLGIMYASGRGLEIDVAKAVSWYKRAAEQGLAEAQFNLGTAYGTGRGVARDDDKAASWFARAAKRGLARAQYNLAAMYEHGRGVRLDKHTALEWYKKAAEQGYAKAQVRYVALSENMRFNSRSGVPGAKNNPAASSNKARAVARSAAKVRNTPTTNAPSTASELAAARPARRASQSAPVPASATASTGDLGDYEESVRAADSAHYTMQLASYSTRSDALRFARSLGTEASVGIYPTQKDGKSRFAVVRGTFDSYQAATDAVADLSGKLSKLKPWIRNFGRIQKQLR